MLNKTLRFIPLVFSFALALNAQTVRFDTTFGGIDVVLTPDVTPQTVANFMSYVNAGSYNNTIIHRSLNPANQTSAFYLIQGGGYTVPGLLPTLIPQNAPVPNEFKTSNTRGTLAMAQYGSDINSATNQWFFNTIDNSGALDSQSFTVFGNVANNASLAVLDYINSIPTFVFDAGANANFADLPLTNNYVAGQIPKTANYVYVNSITPITPAMTAAGVVDAATYASSTDKGISPGEIITVFGQEMGPTPTTTLTVNSSSGLVDTTLEGTQVLFNGVPGPMIFTSTGQVAAVVPYSIANLSTVDVAVTYLGIQTSSAQFRVAPANPGLFTLDSSGKGDAAIVRLDGSVVNAANPAAPGETLELYGEGYGAVSPGLPDGAVVTGPLPVPATLLIDRQKVDMLYAGGAGGDVNGILQINFVVPGLAPGAHQIQIQVGSAVSPTGVTLQTR